MRISLFAAVLAPAFVACASSQSGQSGSTDVQAVQRTIDSMDTKVIDWINREMTDSIVAKYYASDAIVIFPNSPASKGTDAIRRDMNNTYKSAALKLHFQRDAIIVADSVASDHGTYTLEVRAKPDTTKVLASDHGNYVTTFVKRNGEWRALFDIASSEVPMPTSTAASDTGKPATKKK